MQIFQSVTGEAATFRASKGFKTVPVALASLSLSAIPMIALLLISGKLTLILQALLITVVISCMMLAAVSLDELVSSEVIITPDKLSWTSLLSSQTVDWHQVTDAELVAVDGSFATASLESGLRTVGIGITVMSSAPGKPEQKLLLVVGPSAVASDMVTIIDAIKAQRRHSKSPTAQRGRRIAKPVVPQGEFRRPPQATPYQSHSMTG